MKAKRQWSQVGWMLTHHRDGLLSSSFIAWSSIAQSVCEWAFSLLAIRCLETSRFESCFQQRKTTCLLYIRISLACARASKLTTTNITPKSPTIGLSCFQKFVHDNPPKFRHNGLLLGESISWRWFPSQRACDVAMMSYDCIQTAQVYVKQYTLDKTNSVHANTRQCYILGSWSWSTWYIYIYTFRIVIYVINYYSTLQICNEKRMLAFYAHISQCAWTVHISFKLSISLNGQPSTCLIGILHMYFIWILYLRCIIYSYI